MSSKWTRRERGSRAIKGGAAMCAVAVLAGSGVATAQWVPNNSGQPNVFSPGNLVVSRSVYGNNASNVTVGEVLPPDCSAVSDACGAASGAPYNGIYPNVFNDVLYDPSFGVTSRVYLDQITTFGELVNSLQVSNNVNGQLVTSFSSKSELALNLSTDGKYLSMMGYLAPINTIDVSNSNTPDAVDSTNPVGTEYYRVVGLVNVQGTAEFTETNAYSGNNGRAAILNNTDGANFFYTAGNAGNGANPQPSGVVLGAGAQIIEPSTANEAKQAPGMPTPVASFSVTELGAKADKIGKDDNFRGMTIFNNVLYYTKGSGSNGVNTVYFVDTTGTACPNGVGVPAAGAALPTKALTAPSDPSTAGLPNNMCILSGFPQIPNKSQTNVTAFPFGIWFADANTLYVADEGDGYTGGTDLYTHAAAQTTAGLQKWVYNASTKSWSMAYVLKSKLGIGTPYTVKSYPSGTNVATGLPWAPTTDGLRNITGHVNTDGTVTIWAVTSTVSGGGDTGADPNQLVEVIDTVSNTSAAEAKNEIFYPVYAAGFGEVLRGVSFTPGSQNAFNIQQ